MSSNLTGTITAAGNFIQVHPVDYTECVQALKKFAKEHFAALYPESNPITKEIARYEAKQLEFIIREYSGFSNEAIHMLLDAMIRNHDWKTLYEELQHNIDEEKGQETRGIPHLEMMRQGYKIDLGIETDQVEYSEITTGFLKKMRRIFKHTDNAYSAGALLAFEGSAIAEFHILDALVKEFQVKNKLSGKKNSLTSLYIDGHKDFEIGHEAHLFESIKPYINASNIHKMVKGYLAVCLTMNIWWEQLSLESFQSVFTAISSFTDTEDKSVSDAFKTN